MTIRTTYINSKNIEKKNFANGKRKLFTSFSGQYILGFNKFVLVTHFCCIGQWKWYYHSFLCLISCVWLGGSVSINFHTLEVLWSFIVLYIRIQAWNSNMSANSSRLAPGTFSNLVVWGEVTKISGALFEIVMKKLQLPSAKTV